MSDQQRVEAARAEILRILVEDKWSAHQVLFRHRHQYGGRYVAPAEFHHDLVSDFWSPDEYNIDMAFRGSAKSTLAEEDIVIASMLREFHNIVVLSSNETRAAERLASVAFELKNNPHITGLLGNPEGGTWTQTKLVLWDGRYCIQAIGRDQDIRGIKHLDFRPDLVLVDDVESPESVQTPEQRRKTLRWFLAELLQACSPQRKIRIRATPMDAESLPVKLMNEWGWPTKIFPVERIGDDGKRVATWPEVWPIAKIDRERLGYEKVGELAIWQREMMCEITAEADSPFRREMFRVEPRIKTWEPCYAMIDPARTINRTSAATGWAVWSWINNRLIVWGADAHILLPDEIIALGFDICERFDPISLGIEIDGVHQWLQQPFRQEMAKRGILLPLKGTRAIMGTQGEGQRSFIVHALEPYFAAREAIFAQPLPTLMEQLLNFPRGRRDCANALAYAPLMRPGHAIYDGFGADHIVADLDHDPSRPLFLVANATQSLVTAILCQHHDGRLMVLADWVREGGPGEHVDSIYIEAAMAADAPRESALRTPRSWDTMLKAPVPDRLVTRNQPPSWVTPPHHEERYTNVGLNQAIRAVPSVVRAGGAEAAGRLQMQDMLGRIARGLPAVAISPRARWTCRALGGGFGRALVRGRLADYADEGPYRILMEGLESFMGLARMPTEASADVSAQPVRADRYGNSYRSALPFR